VEFTEQEVEAIKYVVANAHAAIQGRELTTAAMALSPVEPSPLSSALMGVHDLLEEKLDEAILVDQEASDSVLDVSSGVVRPVSDLPVTTGVEE